MVKCRGESDLGLCMTSVPVARMPLRSADFRRILRTNMLKNRKSALRSGILYTGTEVMHRPRSDSRLHFDIMYSKFVWKNKVRALSVCRKIPPNDFSPRCLLYRDTIFKSWLQLLSISIFELSNKFPSFRLRHSTNEKLLNVCVSYHSIHSASRNLYYK